MTGVRRAELELRDRRGLIEPWLYRMEARLRSSAGPGIGSLKTRRRFSGAIWHSSCLVERNTNPASSTHTRSTSGGTDDSNDSHARTASGSAQQVLDRQPEVPREAHFGSEVGAREAVEQAARRNQGEGRRRDA